MKLSAKQQLDLMLELAITWHDGQLDRAGAPFILHPLTVACSLHTTDLELMAIAIGHDLIEDTDFTIDELMLLGFSKRVVDAIACLTKTPGESSKHYHRKIKSNIDAVAVKIADLQHNSDLTRLKVVTEKDVRRTKQYRDLQLKLAKILLADLKVKSQSAV